MKIRAYTTVITGFARHYVSIPHKGIEKIPAPKWIEISEEPEGFFFLYHYNSDGRCIADTWHKTLEDAKKQAEFEFEIKDNDWKPVE